MTDVTITYFPSKGRAESIKCALQLARIPYSFNAISDWPTMKEEGIKSGLLPFGQVPLVHIDGMDLVQSRAILRYIGEK